MPDHPPIDRGSDGKSFDPLQRGEAQFMTILEWRPTRKSGPETLARTLRCSN